MDVQVKMGASPKWEETCILIPELWLFIKFISRWCLVHLIALLACK